ncbi:TetR family transcriptional regulator [Streptomyces mirabilis]|uniref:TetR family transcriptional regulator n=1 Tax=Streptomyces mirabilis TaxID=68239 RepID=UPI0033A96159
MGRPPGFDKDKVVQAVERQFRRTGYAGTSVDDIARAGGLGRGSLYAAFGDKSRRSAAALAKQLGETNGWSPSLVRCAMDGLTVVLEDRPPDKPVKLTEVRTRIPRHASSFRVAEVLADLELLEDDSASAIRSWIADRTAELPAGFAGDFRAWILVLLDGDSRAKPRSRTCLYVYFGCVRPLLKNWAPTHGHLREITVTDVTAALSPLRGWQRRNAIAALRSLFRFAKKRGLIFANPTTRLRAEDIPRSLLSMTDAEVLAVQRIAATPAQRLIVALAAVHAARATAIRHLTLDDLDPPNRRITIARHTQRLGELPHQTLLAWLAQRRTAWPTTPNRHVLINAKTALGTGPVSPEYLKRHLLHQGVHLERIRGDRVLHEALTVGADPLHLGLVFNLFHTTASPLRGYRPEAARRPVCWRSLILALTPSRISRMPVAQRVPACRRGECPFVLLRFGGRAAELGCGDGTWVPCRNRMVLGPRNAVRH